VTVVLTDISRK